MSMLTGFRKLEVILVMVLGPCVSHGDTLFVSADGDGTDGLSWNTAFTTIRDAVVASSSGDEVWIRAGTYEENIVLTRSLTIWGGFSGSEALNERESRNPILYPCIVDGGHNTSPVFRIDSTEVTIEGMLITNGLAFSGSGIRITNSTGVFRQLLICNNGDIDSAEFGAGFGISSSNCEILDCIIKDNSSVSGAGLSIDFSTVNLTRSEILNNSANQGGGIDIGPKTTVGIDSCMFKRNKVTFDPPDGGQIGFGGQGGAIYIGTVRNYSSALSVRHCIFDRNDGAGSVIYGRGPNTVLFDQCTCIVGGKTTGFNLGGNYPHPLLTNCIVVGEPGEPSTPISMGEADAIYSLIEGAYPGEGNIDADPKFVDMENGDYHLQRGSPCVDSGTDTGVMTDFDGNPRPIGRYDMGAFEYPFLRSDINVDGAVNAMDLLILQEDRGKVSGP